MYDKTIQQALGHVSDAYLESAMGVYERKRKARKRWHRVAVCAAVLAVLLSALLWPTEITVEDGRIIAQPGVLKVYACDLGEMEQPEALIEHELPEDKYFMRALWRVGVMETQVPSFGRPLSFQIPEEYYGEMEITFLLSSTQAGFCEETILANGEAIYLSLGLDPKIKSQIHREVGEDKNLYLDILIYADGEIVGYGVISCCFYALNCYAYKCTTVCFLPVDGKLQNVSEEYVYEQIDAYKLAQIEGEGTEYIRQLANQR